MSMNVVNGTDLCLFITTGATKKCIALATTCKISVAMATRKISSKDSTGNWEESNAGRLSWSCDSDNLFTQDVTTLANASLSGFSYDALFDVMVSRTPITITIGQVTTSSMGYQQTLGTGKNLSGNAYITKLDANSPNDDSVTFTISMEGTGALSHSA